jgi:hypothetical protein
LRRVFTKSESLGTVQLRALLDLSEATLTGEFVLLVTHFDVVLGETKGSVLGKERAISSIKNVHIGICKVGISINIDRTILVTKVLGHNGSAVSGIFTVQDNSGASLGSTEQFTGETIFVVIVDCAINVASFIFVLEATIDDQDVVELVVELAIHEFQKSAFFDTR